MDGVDCCATPAYPDWFNFTVGHSGLTVDGRCRHYPRWCNLPRNISAHHLVADSSAVNILGLITLTPMPLTRALFISTPLPLLFAGSLVGFDVLPSYLPTRLSYACCTTPVDALHHATTFMT